MLLLELAVQSVRGFSPSARVALKPGLVGLKSPAEQPAPLAGLLTALCYPDGRASEASFLAPGQKVGKAGFSFQANDQTVWRLVRDLGGAGSLHRLNPGTRQYEVVTQDATEMQQTLRQSVGLPPRTTFDQVFTLTPHHFPTLRGKKDDKKGKKKGGFDIAEEQRKVQALKGELEKAREVAELQFKLDGLNSDIYRLEGKLKELEDMRQKVEGARGELNQAPTPERLGLPEDIVDRVKRYDDEKKKYRASLAKVMEEREAALGSASSSKVPSVFRDQRFIGAMALGVLLVAGGAYAGEGALRYLAMLAIGPFSFAALLALRYIEDLQGAARNVSKSDIYDIRIKRVNDEWAVFDRQVGAAMEGVNAATRDEFFTAMQKPEELKTRLAELEVQWAEMQVDPENADLVTRIEQMKRDAEESNAVILEKGGGDGYSRSEGEIARDIRRIEEAIEKAQEPESAANVPVERFDDPTPPLMLLGADLFGSDVPTLWGQLKDRSVQYLTALSDKRYFGAEVDKDGRATLVAQGRKVPATELAGKDLDLWYLSLRLTLIEKYSARARVPVVIEDGLNGIVDDAKVSLLTRMLKHLGTLTQVLHVTGAQRQSIADAGNTFGV